MVAAPAVEREHAIEHGSYALFIFTLPMLASAILEEAEIVLTEMVKRRVVDEARARVEDTVVDVTRSGNDVVVRRAQEDAVAQARDRLRGTDLDYRNWERYFTDSNILVPNLRAKYYRLKLPEAAVETRLRCGQDIAHLRRMEDVRRGLSFELGLRDRASMSDDERTIACIVELLWACEQLRLVASISP